MAAAYEQVRVARVMRSYPALVEAFAAGRVSYSQVRAITRIVTPDTEGTLIGWAEYATAAQIERIVAATRRAIRNQDVKARQAARSLTYRWDEDGSLVGAFRLPPEDAVRFLQGLRVAKAQLPDPVQDAEEVEEAAVRACQSCRDAAAAAAVGVSVAIGEDLITELCPHIAHDLPRAGKQRKTSADALVFLAEHLVHATEQGATERGATGPVDGADASDTDGTDSSDAAGSGDRAGLPGLGTERFQLVLHSSAEELALPDDADDLSEWVHPDPGRAPGAPRRRTTAHVRVRAQHANRR
jgi:hypothetical protein